MMKKTSFFIVLILTLSQCTQKNEPKLVHVSGVTMGTIQYNVKYLTHAEHPDLGPSIQKVLSELNQSLSTYISDSEISILNRESRLTYGSDYFYSVLRRSKEVFDISGGTFDPSIGPLVQAWGFGPEKQIPDLTQKEIDSLKSIVGFGKIVFDEKSVQLPANYQLDFSAIAKGLAVDLVADELKKRQIQNFLVEIGGEVMCSGVNQEEKSWTLGIENPLVAKEERKILAVARLRNKALATSGNYRNYYEKDDKIYAHIIDPRTGRNALHNLLSASVFADDCMTADAFATAFMVLGVDKSITIANSRADLDVILIYQKEDGQLGTTISEGIAPFVELINAN